MPRKMTALKNFRHRVTLASGYTEATKDETDIVLVRGERNTVYASICPVRGEFYINGIATQESRNSYSHNVVIRYNRNIDITGYGWLYETRPSGNRWYKIISVQEIEERERFWQISARLVQKSEDALPPSKEASKVFVEVGKLPEGASL